MKSEQLNNPEQEIWRETLKKDSLCVGFRGGGGERDTEEIKY